MKKRVYIILVNWNGWKDTIECLESLFLNDYDDYKVIVCDNDSKDNSLEKIKEWADGVLKIDSKDIGRKIFYTERKKVIEYIEIKYENILKEKLPYSKTPLILISIDKNLGFAGGTNIGIKYALKDTDMQYIWILNNDTVVRNNALSLLVEKMMNNKNIGICGSRLMEYDCPEKIQALGGKYNKFFGWTKHILQKKDIHKIDYIVGASMLVSKEFIEKIGLLSEDYFLYFEELDWAMRSRKFFQLACVYESVVYHKEGISTGGKYKSELSDYYGIRNRLLFTKKYFPQYLIMVFFILLGSIFNRIRRRQYRRVRMILRIVWENVFRREINKNYFRDFILDEYEKDVEIKTRGKL